MIRLSILVIALLLTIGFIGGYVFNNRQNDSTADIPSSREITADKLSNHSSPESCWTILGGVVYDATNILNKYPVLEEKASLLCGKDGSSLLTIQKFVSNQLDNETIAKINEEIKKNVVGILAPNN